MAKITHRGDGDWQVDSARYSAAAPKLRVALWLYFKLWIGSII